MKAFGTCFLKKQAKRIHPTISPFCFPPIYHNKNARNRPAVMGKMPHARVGVGHAKVQIEANHGGNKIFRRELNRQKHKTQFVFGERNAIRHHDAIYAARRAEGTHDFDLFGRNRSVLNLNIF